MRQDSEHFGEQELELIHVSRRMADARRAEDTLTAAGIDYAVEAERYSASMLLVIPVERVGAFFYVPSPRADEARSALRGSGLQVTETIAS